MKKSNTGTIDAFICYDWRGYHLYSEMPRRAHSAYEDVDEWYSTGDALNIPSVIEYVINTYGDMTFDDEPKLVILSKKI